MKYFLFQLSPLWKKKLFSGVLLGRGGRGAVCFQVAPEEWIGFCCTLANLTFNLWRTEFFFHLRPMETWRHGGTAGMGEEGGILDPYWTVFSIQLQKVNLQHAANFLSFVWWCWHTVEHQAEHPIDLLHKKCVGSWWYMSCNKTTHKGCASLRSFSISSFFSVTLKKSLSLSS